MPQRTHGSCLCGEVRFAVTGALRDVRQCHCLRCQKTSGNFLAATAAPQRNVTIENEETLTWFRPDDDTNVAYGFCRRCGSSLFWKIVDQSDADPSMSICAGTLDDATDLHTAEVWFADHVAEHSHIDPTLRHIASTDL